MENYTKKMIKTGVGNLVGVGLIGASAQAVGGLSAGTAKTLAGTAVGLQGVSLLGPNLRLVNDAFKIKRRK